MNQQTWDAVDTYFSAQLMAADCAPDSVLTLAMQDSDAAGMPAHHVAPNQGKLLQLFAQMCGAKRILEIGTLAGYSTIWLARALAPAGTLITLEANSLHAQVAQKNLVRAGVQHLVEIRLGAAQQSLSNLVAEGSAAFDLIFIDADKPNNPIYLDYALKLARPGTVIIGDNVVRNGAVADAASSDANVQGVRSFFALMSAHPKLSATALQTVGSKGYDGFSLAIVQA